MPSPSLLPKWTHLAVALLHVATAAAAESADPIVELPVYSVSGASPWLIAELDGFVVFSLADEETTARFATHLSESIAVARSFAPASLGIPEAAVPDLLALENPDVARFTPPRDRWGRRAATLPAIVGDGEVSLVTKFGLDWYLEKKNTMPIAFDRRLRLARPALPTWAHEGRLQLCAYGPLAGDRLNLERPRIAAKELMPLSQALDTSTYGDMKTEDGARLVWTRQAFAHWAWLADGGAMRQRWESLAVAAAREPLTPQLFSACMGLTVEDADKNLRRYLQAKPWKTGAAEVRAVDAPRVVTVRRATGLETRRYVATSYLCLARRSQATASAYRRKAITILSADPESDRRNGEMQALLGLALLESGDRAAARVALTHAVEAGVKRPMAYVHLAGLLLEPEPGGDENAVLASARQAMDLVRRSREHQPEMVEAYEVEARACHRLGSGHPEVTTAALSDLERGVRRFPRHASLAAQVVSMLRSHGEASRADELLAGSLAWSPDAPELLAQRAP